jgi:large exoprotein involved in heme utilization and adhesion
VGRESGFSSGASSSVLLDAIGNGGTIQIETGSLFVTNGAVFLAITKSQGNSGNIRIDARDAVTVRGENPANPEFVSTIGAGAEETSTGQGGNLRITTPTLRLQDGGQLSAIHFGQGDAGAIEVQANTIQLENDAAIVTQSSSGNGGDITLTASDLLLMRQDSYIATSATATPERSNLGNGGNITLNTAFLVSAPLENNDIFATAISGRGETSRLMLKASTGSRPAVARN